MNEHLPAIVVVPGFWTSATGVFDQLVTKLKEQRLEIVVAELRSTGYGSVDGITLNDDVAAVRSYIEPLVSSGRKVVVAAHSAGGFIGGAAVEGLTRKNRVEAGKPGGVVSFALICAGVFPRGSTIGFLPFFDIRDQYLYCKDALASLFNGLKDEDARSWNARMRPQPAANWDAEIQHTGHGEVSCYYLVCKQDQLLPTQLQLQFAAAAQAEVLECDAGHMVMLSQVDSLVQFLIQVVEKTIKRGGI